MIEAQTLIAFTLASAAIIIVPGPTVTVIIANSLRHGAGAGLRNVAGTQLGILTMIAVLAAGLSVVVELMSYAFDWLRLIGAAYLIWLGIKLWRARGTLAETASKRSYGSVFWQGFIVIWSNPKALFFFGAFIPQFVDPAGGAVAQTMLLGVIFMVVATVFDGAYAILAGRTGALLSRNNVRIVEMVSGTCLIGGGIWLALARR